MGRNCCSGDLLCRRVCAKKIGSLKPEQTLNLKPYYSVVVPFYNEGENLPRLIEEIDAMLHRLDKPAEIILVNDGSTDKFEKPRLSPHYAIRWLALDRNSGQSAALYYGMQAARGERVILLDADLQNDPADVPAMLAMMDREKLDLITGVRAKRNDNWVRRVASRIGNGVRSRCCATGRATRAAR